MRLATFLIVSIAFHAAAFSYPVHFAEFRRDPVFPVVLLERPKTGQPPAVGGEHFVAAAGTRKVEVTCSPVRRLGVDHAKAKIKVTDAGLKELAGSSTRSRITDVQKVAACQCSVCTMVLCPAYVLAI